MTLNDQLNIEDAEFLKAQIAFNLNQIQTKYAVSEKDRDIAIDNILQLYDSGIKTEQIPKDKHETFCLLMAYRYYNLITDSFATLTREAKGRKLIYSITPITEITIDYLLENVGIQKHK